MALHDSLRELVAARGAAVVDDATELRGALDDFLGEDEATIGELNLLVDAVRLGGLDRMLTMLDHGADPAAAVAEAGAALARDRGSDDTRRAGWAVAALGFALGRVDAGVVERSLPTAAPVDPKPATPPPPPPPPPTPRPSPEPDPGPGTVGSAEAVPTALDRERSVPVSPPPSPPVRRRKRRSVVLLAVSFAVVLGLVGGIGLALWLEREPTTSADDDPEAPRSSEQSNKQGKEEDDQSIGPDDILLTYIGAADGKEYLYKVDAGGAGFEPLTDGGQDHLPSISPNRTQVAYLVGAAGEPRILKLLDIGSEGPRTVFEEGECSYSQRPGWNVDGVHLALICTDENSEPTGMYLADLEDNTPTRLFGQSGLSGAPTWISDDTFVYSADHASGVPGGMWMATVNMADPEDSTAPEELDFVQLDANMSHADWSEENGQLLFLVHPPGSKEYGELWVANSDLSEPRRLGEGQYGHPVWSPEGDAIAFTVPTDDENGALATASYEDGVLGEARIVTGVPDGKVGIPVWGSR